MASLKTNKKFVTPKIRTNSNNYEKNQSYKLSEFKTSLTSSTDQSQCSMSSATSTELFKKKKRIAHTSLYDPVIPSSPVAENSTGSSQINVPKKITSMIHLFHQEFISSK